MGKKNQVDQSRREFLKGSLVAGGAGIALGDAGDPAGGAGQPARRVPGAFAPEWRMPADLRAKRGYASVNRRAVRCAHRLGRCEYARLLHGYLRGG